MGNDNATSKKKSVGFIAVALPGNWPVCLCGSDILSDAFDVSVLLFESSFSPCLVLQIFSSCLAMNNPPVLVPAVLSDKNVRPTRSVEVYETCTHGVLL